MLIIGEKLNSSIPSVRQMISEKNVQAVCDLAQAQAAAGADYLDVNTAQGDEAADMEWLVRTVQEVTDVPLCIDSTSAPVIQRGLEAVKGDKSKVMVNSISLETTRFASILSLILEYNCPVIGLTTDDNGIPKTVEERIQLTERMVELLAKNNYDLANLYVDPLVLPLAVNQDNAVIFYRCLTEIKQQFKVKTVSGLSNISFSMPKRKIINRHFLVNCMTFDMDAAILDPLDRKIMTSVTTVELLQGKDRYAKKYLAAYRQGLLED